MTVLIETDIVLAHIKEDDWLKEHARALMTAADRGEIRLYASREVLHEIYYIARRLDLDMELILERVAYMTQINGLTWLPTDVELDLVAFTLMVEYGIGSVFDAYHAATALLRDPHRTIISTDKMYDKVHGLYRIDPTDYEPEELVNEVRRHEEG